MPFRRRSAFHRSLNHHRLSTEVLLTILEYCWVFCVVMDGNSVYKASATQSFHLLELSALMSVVLLLANLAAGRIRIKKINLLISFLLFVYALIYLVVQWDTMNKINFSSLFLVGLPCTYLLFSELYRKQKLIQLLEKLVNVVWFLGAMSLFFWFFGTVLNILKPNMSMYINWGSFSKINGYYGLHFQFQRETAFGIRFFRNSGIFTEAPMLNLWCNIAMAMELFLKEKSSGLKISVFVATILTTFSTTGLIFLVLCISLKYYHKFAKMPRLAKGLLLLSLLLLIPVTAYALYALLETKVSTVSFLMRASDYIGGIRLWQKHPVFGSGFGNLVPLLEYVYSPNGVAGFSNSITGVLATGGIWMSLLYYFPHITAMFSRFTGNKSFSYFGICFFYLFVSTIFFGRYLAIVMIALDLAILIERSPQKHVAGN